MILKKKQLAARALKVGLKRITFVESRLNEIKEAITKEDIRGLVQSGAVLVKPVKGRRTNVKRKNKRKTGKIKKKVNTRKQDYVIITRKLRKHVLEEHKQGRLSKEEVKQIRKEIRNKAYRSLANLKAHVKEMRK